VNNPDETRLPKRPRVIQYSFVIRSAHNDASRKLRTRREKWLRRLVIALALYTVLGFLILPAIIKWQLRKQLPKFTHREARVDSVRINPYALSLGIRGLALTEPDGSTFASFSNLYVNFEAGASLLNWMWTFKEVQLGTPYGYVAILTNGQFNFANLLTNAPAINATTEPATPPPVLVKHLAITNGTFAVADFYRATPFQTKFTPIDVRLTNFTTRPRTGSPYEFTASTGEGEYFNWAGSVHAIPPASAGKFELGGIDLKKYGTYAREFTQLDVRDGRVTVNATYAFALETNGLELTVTNAGVLLTNLIVFAPDAATDNSNALVSIPSVVVRGAEANLLQRTAKVAAVETIGGSIFARRFSDGTLELLQLAAPPTNRSPSILNPPVKATNAPVASETPAAPWSVLVESIAVNDYTLRVNDEQPPRPASLTVDQIALMVKGLSLASNAPIAVDFAARVNGNGTVKSSVQGTVLPVALETDVDVSGIELRPFQPYVEQQKLKLAFNSGRVSTKGHASLALRGTNLPAAKFSGDVVLDDVAVVDQIVFQDFVKWKQVAVRGIDFALDPMSVKIGELSCDELITSVVMDTNKQLTALAVLPPSTSTNAVASTAPKPVAASGSPVPFPVQLDVLALTNASIRFADLSIEPNCRFSVQQFSGTVRGLSSKLDSAATVDISGRINESAPFSVAGKVNPLVRDLLVDLVISNRNMDLTAFTPYMEKFAGHPLAKGKVSVGLQYSVQQQALEAQNVISIDQLTLGPKNNSPDATKLPVKLGVALLKDREGRIALDVPVKGRLDDPKFDVMPVIWQVVMNLLVKAAASPFSLLGALVGGGEELSYIEFAPGQSTITEVEAAKIDKLGKALYERPALNLEISGAADDSLDRAALAWLKLERELKTARLAELAGKSDAPATLESIRLESREYERLLKAHYKKVFKRDRPLPQLETNAVTGQVISPASTTRNEPRKGAEAQISRTVAKPATKDTNVVVAIDPRAVTRPATLPPLDADDVLLAQMEAELCAQANVTPDDVLQLKQARAQSVQGALLKTEKVTADRLFILAPLPADAASKGQSRVNLSLN
jgi:hypothetical protein